ncbi:unnamed protein product [Didymodactylos carnosus]|uniref:Methyltransferase FkbM domain-containing protein n=1 Tax=Didymodactylos carnosus TaxID=1234261 RepID=A0A814VY42_9BILA|nr:unnamed protein product [Didymodactylos carnosus]CAF1247529.1 unnamed protein product [Didymodactylos carnosus]CAF3957830.1 unnamed protein product [Didymodactylos carnosus]CAF4055161.1 unnamed protein product [Didymodactylos carnosus]
MDHKSKCVIATKILICAAIFHFLCSGLNLNLNSRTRNVAINDVLFDEVQRLRDTLSIANHTIANGALRIKQLTKALNSLKSSKSLKCEKRIDVIKENSLFPKIVPIPMAFSYSVNRVPSVHNSWWTGPFKSGWGNSVFGAFKKFLTSNTVHIDFGAWIGPTVLFAANIAKRVIAFECDPYAEAELTANIRVNPHLSHKISVSSLCISNHIHSTEMTGRGGSRSIISTVGKETFDPIANISKTKWKVNCVPLIKILKEQKLLDGSSDLFIKIDTEGAESIILPSFHEWLSKLDSKIKPTILVSMHSKFSNLKQKPAAIRGILKTFSVFKYATPWGHPLKRSGSSWNESYLVSACGGCDILLTDKEY